MKKRLLSALLAVCMVMTMAPAAFAVDITNAGYGGATLPDAPTISGDVIIVTPENAQYTLDGAYGNIDNKTIHFRAGNYKDKLVLARPTKYEGSGTNYNKKVSSGFKSEKIGDLQKTGVYWYDRTVSNVTFTADEGVVLPGFTSSSGHVHGTDDETAYDYVREIKVVDTNNSHYASCSLENITFRNLTISGQVCLNDYSESNYSKNAVNQNITFDNCTFVGDITDEKTEMKKNTFVAIKMNADNKYYSDITVQNCSFKNYYQGIYIQGVDTAVIANNYIRNTTHNAIAPQSSKSNPAKGTVAIRENVIYGAKDRAIRFGNIAADCDIAINNNVMANSGDDKGELIKAANIPTSGKVDLENNYWNGKELAAAVQTFAPPESVGVIGGTFLVDPIVGLANGYGAVLTGGKYVVDTLNADNAAAAVGSTIYGTLQQAVEAAQTNDTIKLKRDIDWVYETTILDLSDKTLDLNQHKISALNFSLIFEGENCTIKNGYLDSKGGSYALFIGENPTNNFLVEDVTAVGGINIYNSQNVALRNVDVTAVDYYAVWCDQGGQATIEDGVFKAVKKTTALLGMSATDTLLEIRDGYFDANGKPLVLEGNDKDGNPYRQPIITGGYFTSDPSAYLADGKAAVESDKDGYAYMVADASTEPAEVVPEAPHINTDLPADATDEDKKLAESVKAKLNELSVDSDALKAAAGTVAQSNTVSNEDGMKALNEGGISVDNAENVTIVVQPYLDITLKDASSETDGKKSFTVDITPKYRKVATTATDLSQVIVKGEEEDQETANAVIVAESVNLTVNRTVEVSIALPKDFVPTGENKLYVHHQKNGLTYVYEGAITGDADNQTLTFTNPHGFSLFTITTESPVAQIGDNYYATLTDAVADVADGQTIELLKESAEKITVQRNVSFTVDTTPGTFVGSIEAGSNYSMTKTEKDGKITYTFTRNSSSSSSGSSNRTLTFNVNGGSELKKLTKAKGTTIDLSDYVPTRTGYTFAGWYSDKELTDKVTSIKLSENTTVYAKWTKNADETVAGFEDVKVGDWFAEEVQYVVDKGLMSGTSKTTFAPSATTTRGMIVAILHRLEKEPAATASAFTDVKAGAYYEKAINWAAANDIVKGVTETTFAPDQAITREQMAAILYRYAQFKGYDMSKANKLDAYADAAQVSAYAVPAMQWANAENLITGKSATVLDPKGNATRAEVSSILMRFCENIAK